GGQQQRVALARALVIDPSLLLMDEPMGALDARLREKLQVELRKVQREVGITTIYVTHDQNEAFSMSDRVLMMRGGKVVEEGSPEALCSRPKSVFAARFIGQTSLIPVRVVSWAGSAGYVAVDGESSGAEFRATGSTPTPGAPSYLVLRADAISCSRDNGADSLQGVVTARRATGLSVLLTVSGRGGWEVIVIDPTRSFKEGESVSLTWHEDDAYLLCETSDAGVDGAAERSDEVAIERHALDA
ncbi:MAG TPA: ABC transporter ATP-binding protein, partial [Luteitalea sp.]|nr:ABC transporter ATP-binding protein [Luteitalea sp.]